MPYFERLHLNASRRPRRACFGGTPRLCDPGSHHLRRATPGGCGARPTGARGTGGVLRRNGRLDGTCHRHRHKLFARLPVQLTATDDTGGQPASRGTTTFEYSLEDGVRTQWLTSRAAEITRDDVPDSWSNARIVLLGPVANELPLDAADWFSDDSFICAVTQGWQRSRDSTGKVVVSPDVPDGLSERIDAVVVSEADVPSIRVQAWTETFPIVVTTRGRQGARMYADGRLLDVPPVTASEVDSTGAGDVWAAAFAIRLVETDDVTLAASFASAAAAMSVEHRGMRGIPTRDQVIARMSMAS